MESIAVTEGGEEEEEMIRNILFDLVGVIMRFDTEGYYHAHQISPSDQALLHREVFLSLEWAMQDRGAISEEEAIERICARVPARLHEAVQDFIYRRNRAIIPGAGMKELLTSLKDAGEKLYLLSNTSVAFHRFRHEVPGIELFDGELISADVGLVKPDPAIFHLAFERFGIDAYSAAFIDDTPINAEAAQHIGMKAFVFNDDVEALRMWLANTVKHDLGGPTS